MKILSTLIDAVGLLMSPRVCRVCGSSLTSQEHVLCLHCLLQLPRSYVHRQDFNEIHRRLGHHHRVDRAAGWFYYQKSSPYAQLLIDAKYGNLPEIDRQLARMCAAELAADRFFDGIEAIVYMPMYWTKRWIRGYNQAQEIARGVSEVTGIPCVGALRAARSHGIQARHSQQQRHTAIAGTFALADGAAITGRSILLVDDIITSGASCQEALRALAQASPSSINILSLGLTAHH